MTIPFNVKLSKNDCIDTSEIDGEVHNNNRLSEVPIFW